MSVKELTNIEAAAINPVDGVCTLFNDICKYGFVSVFALAVDVGLLYLLVESMGMSHIASATVSFTAGLVVNYTLARIFVFKKSMLPLRQEFLLYALIGVIGLGLNDLIIYLLVWMQVWYMYAKAVSVAIVFFFNFFGRRRLFADQ
jgi:putative flippase GtrA